jgi:glycosyltransferase involved in cell wall biosynthesis
MAKVSICIPVYNDASSLRRCLESIMIQDYRDFDIIITDDSSIEDVEKVVKSFDFKDIKCQYFRNFTALKSPENWNSCIKKAKGEYIKLLHHDDWFTYTNSLRVFVDLMENENNSAATIGVVSSRNVRLEDNSIININTPTQSWINQIQNNPLELICGNFIGSPSAVIHKNGLGIFYDINLKWFVDVEFYANILKNYNNLIVVNDLDAISIGIGDSQISRECENNGFVILFEFFYFLEKWKIKLVSENEAILKSTLNLLLRFNIKNEKSIRSYGYKGELPIDIKKVLILVWKTKIKNKVIKILRQFSK